jgi:hypothetical protein
MPMEAWGSAAIDKEKAERAQGVEPSEEEQKKNKTIWEMFQEYMKEKDKRGESKLVETI